LRGGRAFKWLFIYIYNVRFGATDAKSCQEGQKLLVAYFLNTRWQSCQYLQNRI